MYRLLINVFATSALYLLCSLILYRFLHLQPADDPSFPTDPADGQASVVLLMVRDAYANYVVQTTLDVVPESEEKRLLLEELNSHAEELRNYTFAKHIVAKLSSLNNGGH